MNTEEIQDFQRSHTDWNGKRLKEDGDRGPKTEWALAMSCLDPRRQAIVERACRHVGLIEIRGEPNRGAEIDLWNRRAGQALGSPWCAAFASWCISVEGLPELLEGSAQRLGRLLRNTTLILPGDVMWFPTGPVTGHCGIVIGIGPGEVACVEGNHGDGVRLALRSTSQVKVATPLSVQVWPGVPPGLTLSPVSFEGTR